MMVIGCTLVDKVQVILSHALHWKDVIPGTELVEGETGGGTDWNVCSHWILLQLPVQSQAILMAMISTDHMCTLCISR